MWMCPLDFIAVWAFGAYRGHHLSVFGFLNEKKDKFKKYSAETKRSTTLERMDKYLDKCENIISDCTEFAERAKRNRWNRAAIRRVEERIEKFVRRKERLEERRSELAKRVFIMTMTTSAGGRVYSSRLSLGSTTDTALVVRVGVIVQAPGVIQVPGMIGVALVIEVALIVELGVVVEFRLGIVGELVGSAEEFEPELVETRYILFQGRAYHNESGRAQTAQQHEAVLAKFNDQVKRIDGAKEQYDAVAEF
ncbi:hypothetical protein B0H66DRAFT_605163 [Apodospora peruviana]|uniref:Uncharacterized protein n=1 Tax=Apodospora peruviana TaxID=516989 RepID=A0AAE0I3E8_9PEZI|nr:hypothetical protein B0H66DRAFT_605163 [Apodospora peruviana]